MNTLFKKVMIAAVVLPLTFSTVYAKGDGHRGNMDAMPIVKMLRQVDLTTEQKEEVRTIIQNYRTPNNKDLLQDKMIEILKADKFDMEKAQALVAEKDALRDAKQVKKLQMRHDIYQALTAEQQAKMELLLEMDMQKMSKRQKGKNKGQGQGQRQDGGQSWLLDN